MKYVVSLSGGVSSALAAERTINKYGKENVVLWFGDTNWEDKDLYRFLDDLEKRWGIPIIYHKDGRNPLQVASDRQIIPNSFIAPCTFVLKIEPFRKFLEEIEKPVTVLLGLDYTEMHRMERPKKNYEEIEGVTVDFPLMWKPYEFDNYFNVVKQWGIEVPRLYNMGFKHNNCGGRCVKQGIKEWQRLKVHMPERFDEVSDWEQEQRAKGGPRADYAISKSRIGGVSKPLTLLEIKDKKIKNIDTNEQEDLFACFCSY